MAAGRRNKRSVVKTPALGVVCSEVPQRLRHETTQLHGEIEIGRTGHLAYVDGLDSGRYRPGLAGRRERDRLRSTQGQPASL